MTKEDLLKFLQSYSDSTGTTFLVETDGNGHLRITEVPYSGTPALRVYNQTVERTPVSGAEP